MVSSEISGGGTRGGSPGYYGAGGVRDTEEERAGSGREFKKASLCYCLSSSQRNIPRNVRGLKQNFTREKSQKTKIRTRDK